MANRITMADVAREVGVSLMTVSRVVNEKGDVSEQTRQRVLDAIQRLGYRPSGIARSLATRQTGTLGLVVPDIANPFFAEIARGVEHDAYRNGYNVFLCNTEEDPQRELDVLASLEEKRIDGLILCSSRLSHDDVRLVSNSFPAVVLVNRKLENPHSHVGMVLVNDNLGGRLATMHLIQRGHTSIAMLTGPEGSRSGQCRIQGYQQVLQSQGLHVRSEWMRPCAPVAESGHHEAKVLLQGHPEITALLCYNDLVAVGALRACVELKRDVPDDIAVVGFDDIPLAALVTPTLTTCRIERYELGSHAVRILFERMRDEPHTQAEIYLEPELLIRSSAP